MSSVKNTIKSVAFVFLMINISSVYAKRQQSADRVEEAQAAVSVEEAACLADEACDVATSVLDEDRYGGIKQEYVVKGCKVTIYNDGPVKMVDEKTDEPCDAPLPKDHQFSQSKEVHTYQENDCVITEQISMDGAADATMDCSKRDQQK
ncbi:MAG: hypothetical protein RR575_08185 [Acinetobacter sp.]